MKRIFFYLIAAMSLLFACTGQKVEMEEEEAGILSDSLFAGDTMLYGLACDGCTDSVLVLLPGDGSDPVRYDIIDAKREGRVLGRPRIGDWIGVVVNDSDSLACDLVINLEQLKGTWCYIVKPKLRDYDKMSRRMLQRIMNNMNDSLREAYLVPREYGFTLKNQYAANVVGMVGQQSALEDESPVVYPMPDWYVGWHMMNGKLLLFKGDRAQMSKQMTKQISTEEETNDSVTVKMDLKCDTTEVIYLDDDSLVLRYKDFTRSYYRRANASDANKEAREKAEKQAREAEKRVKED